LKKQIFRNSSLISKCLSHETVVTAQRMIVHALRDKCFPIENMKSQKNTFGGRRMFTLLANITKGQFEY